MAELQIRPEASVIILVKNSMPDVERCLAKVFNQKTPWQFEVLVIDSGSTDGTLDALAKYPVRLTRIPPEQFNHGGTRNLGAKVSKGRFLVFLVPDAIPRDENWLRNLVNAANEDGVAGAYSRQLPRPEHNPIVQWAMQQWPTSERATRSVQVLPRGGWDAVSQENRLQLAMFDDVSSCIRRSVWEKFPYRNACCEDIDWSYRVMQAGYGVVFEPASTVFHSHQRSAFYELKRAYVVNRQLHRILGIDPIPSFPVAIRHWMWSTVQYWKRLMASKVATEQKLKLFFWSPAYALRILGLYFGIRSIYWLPRHSWLRRIDQLLTAGV